MLIGGFDCLRSTTNISYNYALTQTHSRTGATGYVGGRLVPRLLEAGYRVRVLVRDPARLQGRSWLNKVDVVSGDALMPETLTAALKDVSIAYYLIHGKQGGRDNADRDLQVARNFAEAASEAKIEQIIYLGELVDPTTNLSPYLRARHETGYILRYSSVPVTEFRAGMIVGSGSAFFEMIRYLSEREPLLVCPAWFFSQAQPIAIRDVLSYLISALEIPRAWGVSSKLADPPVSPTPTCCSNTQKNATSNAISSAHRSTHHASQPIGCI